MPSVNAFFSLEDEKELLGWSDRFASVSARSYMRGYRDIYRDVGAFHKLMIRFCDSLVNMKIIKIVFLGGMSMSRHDEIWRSYKELGNIGNIYDGIITRSTTLGRMMDSLIWGLDKELAARWIEDALAPIPADFDGRLLEVPVGTGVLTMPLYASLPKAGVTCLDYSVAMMENAKKRAAAMKLANVAFVQGDAGALPFADESFDLVLSLNGFHAFPDKDAAFRETFRVLRKGGVFCGCFYIAGEFKRTDWFVKHIYVPRGFFTPPFETRESLEARLRSRYSEVEVHAVRAEGIFRCRKGEQGKP